MAFKSRVQGFVLKMIGPALMEEKGHKASDAIGTLHVAHFVPFENNHLGFFTIFDGDFEKYIQDFADKTSFTFNTLFPNVVGSPPTPVAKNAQAFLQWATENNYPPIGFYSAYPGLSVKTFEPCWPITSHNRSPLHSSVPMVTMTRSTEESRCARSRTTCIRRVAGQQKI